MLKVLKRSLYGLLTLLLLLPVVLLLALRFPGWMVPHINQRLPHYLNVPASLGGLQLELWPLRLEIHQLRLGDDSQPLLGFERATVQLSLEDLQQQLLRVQDIRIEGLRADLQLDEQGRLNLLQALNLPPPGDSNDTGNLPPLAVRLDQFIIENARLRLRDRRLKKPLELDWRHLWLRLGELDSRGGDASLRLVMSGPAVPTLSLSSHFNPLSLQASGRSRLSGLQLAPLTRYLQPMPVKLSGGELELASQFHFDGNLKLHNGRLALRGLQLDEGKASRLRLAELQVENLALDLAQQQVSILRLSSSGLQTAATRAADGSVDWQVLAERSLAAAGPRPLPLDLRLPAYQPAARRTASADGNSKAGSQAAPPPSKAGKAGSKATTKPAPPWQLSLGALALRDYHLRFSDQSVQPAAHFDIGPLSLETGALHSDPAQPVELKLQTAIAPRGKLAVSGQLQPLARSGELQLELGSIDLRVLQGWITPYLRVKLLSGELDSHLQISASAPQGKPLALGVKGSAAINQLHLKDQPEDRDLLKWRQLAVEDIDYQHTQQLRIGRIHLLQPWSRIQLDAQRRTNLQALLVEQPASSTSTGSKSASPPLHVQIGATEISDGGVDFADRSLTPNFAASLQQLQGRIGALDNRSNRDAAIDISGKVDRYAPVSIRGLLTPFDPLQRLDVTTRFQRVELTTLTPYSGKFAGYRIRKGRMNLDLHYRIDQGRLQADNKLVLENLQLGDKVDSPDATDLPVRLAVALLKDSQGNIDLELPIQGDLNNPEFSVAPLIGKTLGNMIAKAVTSPFRLLVGLANADEGADQISFAPGSSALDDNARERLQQVAAALQDREQLKLEVEGLSTTTLDGPLLASARLQREYQRLWYRMQQERGAQVPEDALQVQVPDDERPALLEAIYRIRLRQPPPAEWQSLQAQERQARLQQALQEHWSDSELLLRQLAQERAAAMKEYLVEQLGLDDQRIYLIDVSLGEAADGRIPSRLHLAVD